MSRPQSSSARFLCWMRVAWRKLPSSKGVALALAQHSISFGMHGAGHGTYNKNDLLSWASASDTPFDDGNFRHATLIQQRNLAELDCGRDISLPRAAIAHQDTTYDHQDTSSPNEIARGRILKF